MRIPDFTDFLESMDIEELRELAADENPGVKAFQFKLTDGAAFNSFVNLLRKEMFDSDERLILAYLTLYHRWLQDVLAGD